MDGIGLHEDPAAEPLRPWLPADLLDNAARTISDNKTIMLGLPVLAAIALLAVQAALTEVAVPGGISGFFGADDPFQQAGAALLLTYGVQLVLFTVVSSMLAGSSRWPRSAVSWPAGSAHGSCCGWSGPRCPRWLRSGWRSRCRSSS
ncbi:hypothetical protein [Kribbella sp. CA-247076]|uniref:hypothetical protein n=1 Tax=Kribbella sp. CA-247076 TaxID=3239941 RepID=UPI003D94242B